MSNLIVVDGNQQDRSDDFNLVSDITSPEILFAIESNEDFYYGSNANTLENYTFTIDCIANGVSNTLTIPGPTQLSNFAPFVKGNISYPLLELGSSSSSSFASLFPLGGGEEVKDLGSIGFLPLQSLQEIFAFKVENGTVIANRVLEEVLCTVEASYKTYGPNGSILKQGNINSANQSFLLSYDSSVNEYQYKGSGPRISTVVTAGTALLDGVIYYPTWEFKFNLYDQIVGGGAGVVSTRFNGNTWMPISNPAPQIKGNNNLQFIFNIKFIPSS